MTSEMVDAVFSTSGGLIGRAVVQLREAAILSIEEGDQPLTLERLMDARVIEALASLPTSKQKR
ncbi:hypothetical protein [Caulobacter sp. BE254]|uniref:hypothetical protein n=1 Tax=Caulobacter sp. BE254 TaxID=2817720 RepID=UPI00285E7EA3|nr:hypothetical protein [Caulobacter sp. BE254]MDR7114143.1 hypothetical protein [Caulobacter sp. BE254]